MNLPPFLGIPMIPIWCYPGHQLVPMDKCQTDQYSIIGQGTTGDPLRMGDMGAMMGQYLAWDGSKWFPDAYRGLFLGAFQNQASLVAAHPTAKAGNYAVNQETDTIWIWDAQTTAWVDSGNGSSLLRVLGIEVGDLSPGNQFLTKIEGSVASFYLAEGYHIIQGSVTLNERSMGTYYLDSSNNSNTVNLPDLSTLTKSLSFRFIAGIGNEVKKIYLASGDNLGTEINNGLLLNGFSEPGKRFIQIEEGQLVTLVADIPRRTWRVVQWENGQQIVANVDIVTDSSLSGDGSTASPLRVTSPGISQVRTNDSLIGDGTPANPLAVKEAGLSQVATDSSISGSGTQSDPLRVTSPGLQQVAVDESLAGNGTTGSPLRVKDKGLSEVVSDTTLSGKGTVEDPLRVVTPASSGNWLPEGAIAAPQVVNFATPFVQQGYEGNIHTGLVGFHLENAALGAEVLIMHDGRDFGVSLPPNAYLVDFQNRLSKIEAGKFNRILFKLLPGVGGTFDVLIARVDVADYEVYDHEGYRLIRNWQQLDNYLLQGRGNALLSTASGWTGGGSNYNAVAVSSLELPIDKDARLRWNFVGTEANMVGFASENEPSNSDFQYRILSQAGGAFSRIRQEAQELIGSITGDSQVWGINISRGTGSIEFGYEDMNGNFQVQQSVTDLTPELTRVKVVTRGYSQATQNLRLWIEN